MPYNRELFRSIMNELIDGSTQIEFANTHGISPEHLSRMMRSDTAGRPSKSTLKKIAGGSETVYDALLRACGHIKEKASTKRLTMMSHLTCMGATKEDIRHHIELMKSRGVQNVMALRGDLKRRNMMPAAAIRRNTACLLWPSMSLPEENAGSGLFFIFLKLKAAA